jgi:hypothetical protein
MDDLLTNQAWTAFANGTREHFTKLLLLEFFSSSIYLQDCDSTVFAGLGESIAESPAISMFLGHLHEPSRDSHNFPKHLSERYCNMNEIRHLADTVNFLLRLICHENAAGLHEALVHSLIENAV